MLCHVKQQICKFKFLIDSLILLYKNDRGLAETRPLFRINLIRQRLTFPGPRDPSIISPEGLNFRVRNGNGCNPLGIATGNCF